MIGKLELIWDLEFGYWNLTLQKNDEKRLAELRMLFKKNAESL